VESDPYRFEYGPPAYVLWHEYRWYYDHRTGYYRDSTTRGLHVAVWEHFHQCRRPAGHDVHHRDHDKTNNAPGNLELKPHGEHVAHHNHEDQRGVAGWDTGRHSASARNSWPRAEREFTCTQCGGTGRSSGQTPKYCSEECRKLAILARQEDLAGQYARTTADPAHPVWGDPAARERKCTVCGVAYRTLATRSKYCSPDCCATAMARRRYTLTCVDCGGEFEAARRKRDPRCEDCQRQHNSASQKAAWARKQPVRRICEECGEPYETRQQNSPKYCSQRCGDKARLALRIADQMS
jgi:hypothetical protein